MAKISEFINEVQSIDVSIEKYYCNEDAELIKEEVLPEDAREYYILIDLYVINKSSESKIRALYNNARLSLARLSKENLKSAARLLISYSYTDLYNESQSYLYKLKMGNAQREDEEILLHSMQTHLMFDVPNNGVIVGSFVVDMLRDVMVKNKYLYALIEDILELFQDINKENKIKKSQNLQIHESALIEVIKENLNQYGDITIEFEYPDQQISEENTTTIFSNEPEKASTDLQLVQSSPHSNTTSRFENNDKPINNNHMDINFEAIFEIALTYADDLAEMKAYFIREQKKANRDFFYQKENFYKGLLKIVSDRKELEKYQLEPGPRPTHIGTFFIAGGGGNRYDYNNIELLEQMINEICKEDEFSQKDKPHQIEDNKYAHYTALQWGAIIYYANTEKLLPKSTRVDDMLSAFKDKHNIKLADSTLKVRYYEAARKITVEFNYPADDLEDTIPFFLEHYNKLADKIKNEVKYIREENEQENYM